MTRQAREHGSARAGARCSAGAGGREVASQAEPGPAEAYQDAGLAAEAIPVFEQTLADRERVLGPDHPDTLASRNNLAVAHREAGRAG